MKAAATQGNLDQKKEKHNLTYLITFSSPEATYVVLTKRSPASGDENNLNIISQTQ